MSLFRQRLTKWIFRQRSISKVVIICSSAFRSAQVLHANVATGKTHALTTLTPYYYHRLGLHQLIKTHLRASAKP